MDERDPVRLQREVVEISGGRRLYNYTFTIEKEAAPAAPSAEGNLGEEGSQDRRAETQE
jgi:hypothetical protein